MQDDILHHHHHINPVVFVFVMRQFLTSHRKKLHHGEAEEKRALQGIIQGHYCIWQYPFPRPVGSFIELAMFVRQNNDPILSSHLCLGIPNCCLPLIRHFE